MITIKIISISLMTIITMIIITSLITLRDKVRYSKTFSKKKLKKGTNLINPFLTDV